MSKRCRVLVLSICLLAGLGSLHESAILRAQSDAAALTGFVSDPSGAAIQSAAVGVRNPATGAVPRRPGAAAGRFAESDLRISHARLPGPNSQLPTPEVGACS